MVFTISTIDVSMTRQAIPFALSSTLRQDHLEDLLKSGLSRNTIERLGVTTSLSNNSWIIPIWDIRKNEVLGYRAKYDREALDKNQCPGRTGRGHIKRYRALTKLGNRLFYPHVGKIPWTKIASDRNFPIFITEGEKKAAKLTQEDYYTIGLFGVDAWLHKIPNPHYPTGTRYITGPLDDFKDIRWDDRTVYIVFDADKYFNGLVLQAEQKLADYISSLGARVKTINLPKDLLISGVKAVDDFFVYYGNTGKARFEELL